MTIAQNACEVLASFVLQTKRRRNKISGEGTFFDA